MLSPAPACPFSLPEPPSSPWASPGATASPPALRPEGSGQAPGLLGAGTGRGPGLRFQPRSSETGLHIDPLPTARKTSCPPLRGLWGAGDTPPPPQHNSIEVARPDGREGRTGPIRPGFAACQLVPSGKFPGPSEPPVSRAGEIA